MPASSSARDTTSPSTSTSPSPSLGTGPGRRSLRHLTASSTWWLPVVGLGVLGAFAVASLAAPSMPVAAPSAAALLSLLPWLLIVGAGLVSGFLAGLLGIGGALVTVPTFYFVLPMLGVGSAQLPAAVIGSALLTMAPTTIAAAWRQARHGALHFGWMKRLAPAMAVGAVAGAALASQVHGPLLSWLFAGQAMYYGVRLIADHRDNGGASQRGLTWRLSQMPASLAGVAMSGFVAAVGMGGGSMVAPFLRHRGVDLRAAVATASALNLCVAFGGSGAFILAAWSAPAGGGAHYPAAIAMGIAAVMAVPLGVALAHRLPVTRLRALIGAINVIAAVLLASQLVAR